MGGQEHFYMETQGLIAIPKGEASEMELFVASQHAAYTQVCITPWTFCTLMNMIQYKDIYIFM